MTSTTSPTAAAGGGFRPRTVHPGAWWVWATALAIAVSTTTNPVLLGLVWAVVAFVVLTCRTAAPWARNLRLYLWLGAFIVVSRVFLHVLVGLKTGSPIVLDLPRIDLPSWAKGITLLGPVGLGGLVGAALEGTRLATMLLCFAAANALANPRRLLKGTPAAVRDIGTATVIALSVAPQLVESVQRVRTAQVLRGGGGRRQGGARRIALPVLHDTLEGAIALAASMDSRGYARTTQVSARNRRITAALTLGGAMLVCLGLYGVMQGGGGLTGQGSAPWWMGLPALVLGLALSLAGVVLTSRLLRRTRYRRDPWGLLEWAVIACGLTSAFAIRWVLNANPAAVSTPIAPLTMPAVPWLLPLAVLPAAAPALFAPVPKAARRTRPQRRTDDRATSTPDVRNLRGSTHDN